jgi:hypothetical protein
VVSSVQVPTLLSAAIAPAASFRVIPSGSRVNVHMRSEGWGLYDRSTKSMYFKIFVLLYVGIV